MKSKLVTGTSVSGKLLATLVQRPGRNEIMVTPVAPKDSLFANKIELNSGENVLNFQWLLEDNNEYLCIMLDSGVILVYSPLTKDYINKISNDDSPLSCFTVSNGSADNTVIAYDSKFNQLKLYKFHQSQIINTVSLQDVNDVKFIQHTDLGLLLASDSMMWLLNDKFDKIQWSFQLPSDTPSKVLQRGEELIFIDQSNRFYTVDVTTADSKAVTFKTFIANDSIMDLEKITDDLLYVITSNGSIEIFNLLSEKLDSMVKLSIQGGEQVGKFTKLLPLNKDLAQLSIFKGVWYDSFNVNLIDFEFDDLLKLEGTVPIQVQDEDDAEQQQHHGLFNNEGADEDEEEDDGEEDGINQIALDPRHQCDSLDSLIELLKPFTVTKMTTTVSEDDNSNKVNDLTSILAQNDQYIKPYTHLLSKSQSLNFFPNLSQCFSQFIGYGSIFQLEIKEKLRAWFQCSLLLKGEILVNDQDCVEWLKLIQSNFNNDSKILHHLLKLNGKLDLLKNQLTLRNSMATNGQIYFGNDDEQFNKEDSVAFEGEGGVFDDEDEDEDDEDESDSEGEGEAEGEGEKNRAGESDGEQSSDNEDWSLTSQLYKVIKMIIKVQNLAERICAHVLMCSFWFQKNFLPSDYNYFNLWSQKNFYTYYLN